MTPEDDTNEFDLTEKSLVTGSTTWVATTDWDWSYSASANFNSWRYYRTYDLQFDDDMSQYDNTCDTH